MLVFNRFIMLVILLQLFVASSCQKCEMRSFSIQNSTTSNTSFKNSVLSRKKRFLTFPKDSEIYLTFANLRDLVSGYPMLWKSLVEAAIFYHIPTLSQIRQLQSHGSHPEKKYSLKRDRREIFAKIEGLLDSQGLDGHSCVLRIICEIKYLAPRGFSLVHDIFYIIFGKILQDDSTSYGPEEVYNVVSKNKESECNGELTTGCPVSILQFLLFFNTNTYLK